MIHDLTTKPAAGCGCHGPEPAPCGCHSKQPALPGGASAVPDWQWIVMAALAALVLFQALAPAEFWSEGKRR